MRLKYIVLSIFLIASIIYGTTQAFAHDWYDYACCSNNDCHPIDCSSIIERGKTLIYKGWEFTGGMIRPSHDGSCHACVTNEFSKEFTPVPHCLYILQNS